MHEERRVQDEASTMPHAKLSPPEEHETVPTLDVRLPIFADAEAWSQVRSGLKMCFVAMIVFIASIPFAFAASFLVDVLSRGPAWGNSSGEVFWIVLQIGVATGCILCFIGGLKCRQLPEGNRGGGKMVLCLCAHSAWVLMVAGNAAYQCYWNLQAGHPVRLHTLNRIDNRYEDAAIAVLALFALAGTMFWLAYLVDIAKSLMRPDLRDSCKLCLMMSPLFAALFLIPNRFGEIKALVFLTGFPFLFFWLFLLLAKCFNTIRFAEARTDCDDANNNARAHDI